MATLAPSTRSNTITLASAGAGPFLVGFRLFETNSLAVFVNDVASTDWTLTANFSAGYDDAATITFGSALAAADVIQIDGEMIPRREADYLPADPGLTRKLNIELPRIWMAIQELTRKASRSVRSMTAMDAFVPEVGRSIIFDADLNPIAGPTSDEIANAQSYAERAELAAGALTSLTDRIAYPFDITLAAGRGPYALPYDPGSATYLDVVINRLSYVAPDDFTVVAMPSAPSGQGILFAADHYAGDAVMVKYGLPVGHDPALNTALSYATLADFDAAVTAGLVMPNGQTVTAGGVRLVAEVGAALTGLPLGWRPADYVYTFAELELWPTDFRPGAQHILVNVDGYFVAYEHDPTGAATDLTTANGQAFIKRGIGPTDLATLAADVANSIRQNATSGIGVYGGTANAITLAVGSGYSTIPTRYQVRFRATATNTGAATVAVDGLPAVALRTVGGVALPAGYLRTDVDTTITYDGTYWVVDAAVPETAMTRAQLVAYVAGRAFPINTVMFAGGLAYRYIGTGTAIADMPGWVPDGDVTPNHFGATQSATVDSVAAYQAAGAYVASIGGGVVKVLAGSLHGWATPLVHTWDNVSFEGPIQAPDVSPLWIGATNTDRQANFRAMMPHRIVAMAGFPAGRAMYEITTDLAASRPVQGGGPVNLCLDCAQIADYGVYARGHLFGFYEGNTVAWPLKAAFVFSPQAKDQLTWSRNRVSRNTAYMTAYLTAITVDGAFIFRADTRRLADDGIEVFENCNLSTIIENRARMTGTALGFEVEDSDSLYFEGNHGNINLYDSQYVGYSTKSANNANNYPSRHHEIVGGQGTITVKAATTSTGKPSQGILITNLMDNAATVVVEPGNEGSSILGARAMVRRTQLVGAADNTSPSVVGSWFVGVGAKLSAAVPIAHLTSTHLVFDFEFADPLAAYAGGIITIPGGVYQIQLSANVSFGTTATTGYRSVTFQRSTDGGTVWTDFDGNPNGCVQAVASAGLSTRVNVTSSVILARPGYKYRCIVQHDAGVSLDVLTQNTWLSARFL